MPLLGIVGQAHAQSASTIVVPVIAQDYARGRNLSVIEQPLPDYDAIGVRIGAFVAWPSLGVTSGATDNVYINNTNKKSDAFFTLEPAVRIASNWSAHQVSLSANAELRRHAHETLRDQNTWYLNAQSRFDVTREVRVFAQFQANHAAESPYADDVTSNVSVLSQYKRTAPSLRVERQAGRTRFVGTVERVDFRFNTLEFEDGTTRSQRERDRTIDRFAAQGEFALSPSIGFYAQVNHDATDYLALRASGALNRDSSATSLVLGTNFDLAGLMRGTIGAGYVRRNYDAALYEDISGLSLQSQFDFFVSPLTTVSLTAQSLLQDANIGNSGAYRDTRYGLRIDHALRRNLILTMTASRARQKLNETSSQAVITLAGLSGYYQSNRSIGIIAGVQYGRSRPGGTTSFGVPFDELRGQVSVRLRR